MRRAPYPNCNCTDCDRHGDEPGADNRQDCRPDGGYKRQPVDLGADQDQKANGQRSPSRDQPDNVRNSHAGIRVDLHPPPLRTRWPG